MCKEDVLCVSSQRRSSGASHPKLELTLKVPKMRPPNGGSAGAVPSSFSWLPLEEFFSQAGLLKAAGREGLFVREASVIPCKGLSSAAHG